MNYKVTVGKLPNAHETVEAVRDEIGQLHERNNIESFSDRMNAYHAEMEHVLEIAIAYIDADATRLLNEKAAVLSYLVTDITRIPPLQGINNPEYDKLITAFETSVQAFQDATRKGGADAIKAAVSKLKVPYSKLFLIFG